MFINTLGSFFEGYTEQIKTRYLVSLHIRTYMHYAFITYILATTVNVQHATDTAKGELKMTILANRDINICIIL